LWSAEHCGRDDHQPFRQMAGRDTTRAVFVQVAPNHRLTLRKEKHKLRRMTPGQPVPGVVIFSHLNSSKGLRWKSHT